MRKPNLVMSGLLASNRKEKVENMHIFRALEFFKHLDLKFLYQKAKKCLEQ